MNPKNPTESVPPVTRNRIAGWGVIASLVGAGALPCPGCGAPLAWHLWPLAGALLIARLIQSRRSAASAKLPVCAAGRENKEIRDDALPDSGSDRPV